MRNLMLIKKALKVGSEKLVERSHRLNSQTYLMAFFIFKRWIVNEIGSKSNCRSYKNQRRRKKNNLFFDLGKEHFISRN